MGFEITGAPTPVEKVGHTLEAVAPPKEAVPNVKEDKDKKEVKDEGTQPLPQ